MLVAMFAIERPEAAPSRAAEMALGLVPAAIGNAVFDATGVRLRRVPFTPELRLAPALDRTALPVRPIRRIMMAVGRRKHDHQGRATVGRTPCGDKARSRCW